MQKKRSLCAEFCSSRAADEASGKLWTMLEFNNDLQIICHNSGISLGQPAFKGKQGVSVFVCQAPGKSHSNLNPRSEKLFSGILSLFSKV